MESEFDLKHIGRNIKILREQLGLLQIELAEKINISSTALARYERGETEPKLKIFFRIAQFFGVSMETLISYQSVPH